MFNPFFFMRRKVAGFAEAKNETAHIKLTRIRFYDVGRSDGVAA